jgi:hypothetical protein
LVEGAERQDGLAPGMAPTHPRALGSRFPSDIRINELGEGLSSNMTILSEGLSG